MSDETVNLSLPYILPSQAQKHVTHNEALQRLDAVVQLTITGELASAPSATAEGECYLIAAAATGAWSGKDGMLAFRQDGAWIYIVPRNGWRAFFLEDGRLRGLSSGEWKHLSLPADGSLAMIGVNATPDGTNRLAVSSQASLFNHEGHGHQIKVNKAAIADTASLLFQSAWSGRAEMGLAGNDEFAVKVSGDGASWQTALAISAEGVVKTPGRPAARASFAAGISTPANGNRTGFNDLHVQQGGFVLGAAVPSGAGNQLVVPASGLYLLLLTASTLSSSGHGLAIEANGTTVLASVTAPASAAAARHTAIGLVSLVQGDWLSLLHTGTAQYEFGAAKTEISVIML